MAEVVKATIHHLARLRQLAEEVVEEFRPAGQKILLVREVQVEAVVIVVPHQLEQQVTPHPQAQAKVIVEATTNRLPPILQVAVEVQAHRVELDLDPQVEAEVQVLPHHCLVLL
jgi:hypothetical protein